IAAQEIRTLGLRGFYVPYIFRDQVVQFWIVGLRIIEAARPNSINGSVMLQPAHERKEKINAPANRMDKEKRRLAARGAKLYQNGAEAGCFRLRAWIKLGQFGNRLAHKEVFDREFQTCLLRARNHSNLKK